MPGSHAMASSVVGCEAVVNRSSVMGTGNKFVLACQGAFHSPCYTKPGEGIFSLTPMNNKHLQSKLPSQSPWPNRQIVP